MNIVILITIATVAIIAAVRVETIIVKKEMVKSEEMIKNYIDFKAKLTSVDIGFRLDNIIAKLDEDHTEIMEELPKDIKKMIIQQLVVPVRKSF